LFWETGFELVESNLHEKYLIEDKNAVNLGISKFDLNDSQWFRVSVFKMFGGIGDNRSAHGRGGPSPFSMKKRTKIHVIRNASLPHMASALQIRQNLGCNILPRFACSSPPLHAKHYYALPRTRPPSFCLISPEAYLLTGK